MSIPRRLCADTIRDFARYVGECGDETARAWLLACAEAYIRGEGLDIGQPATTHHGSVHGQTEGM